MSRIDEALKRASQGGVPSRGGRVVDPLLRLADDRTLDEYPLETRASSDRVERPGRADRSSNAAVPAKPWLEGRIHHSRIDVNSNEKLMLSSARSALSQEQYRRLAASLHDGQVEKGLKTIVVTSALPKEGKTLTAVNLAFTLSESYGRRVLLIDADLRRPAIHSLLGLPNDRGLGDVLRSDGTELPTVQVSPLLSVVPAGRPDSSPLAGLSSERMRQLLDECADRYEWVILDTPPIALLPDAQLLARLTQAVVFVIRAGVTPYHVVDKAISEMGRDCVVGTVLNGVEPTAIHEGGYSEYYEDSGQ